MAASPTGSHRLSAVSLAIFIFFFISVLLPLSSAVLDGSADSSSGAAEVEKRQLLTLGSRPPQCFNKCFDCSPCTPALVSSPNQLRNMKKSIRTNLMASSLSEQEDLGYYPQTWKCSCGDKLYQL